ncbi:hypothetical protein VHEMI04588 [[Torrubiella] hemipterigena]|uniref:Uncharacterized protein n=1 Tax=[Torrubiella] hemipterigena TaxID=1531966 RepID=A0A0A1SVR3_9HYPO|nr:hypothetical protein VHEMI04588 [[Torrubiella] hemipterigena]
MAPPKPIPSKLVINTLRGVVFTTSCSVILLAEERRRRIKIARAAVENARKLHTAKVNRGAIALGDGYVGWDGRLIDPSDEILATMPIRTSRRHRTSNGQSLADTGSVKSLSSAKAAEQPTPSESQLAQRTAKAAAAREAIRQPILFSAPPQTFQNERLKISQAAVETVAVETPKTDQVKATTATSPTISTNATEAKAEISGTAEPVKETAKSKLVLFKESSEALESILARSRRDGMSSADAKRCSNILQKLSDAGKFHGPRAKEINDILLKILAQSKDNAPLSNRVLEAALRLSRTPEHVLGPYLSESLRQTDGKQTKQIASFFAKNVSASVHLPKVFRHLAMTQVSRADAYRLFETLQQPGVFQKDSEYQVRRQLILHAKKERDFAWILAQKPAVINTKPKNTEMDISLQTAITAAQASAGNIESVRSTSYKLLKSGTAPPTELKQLVSEATDLLIKNQSAAQLDQWLRSITRDFGLTLEPRWAKTVSNAYMSNPALAMENWFSFCNENGVPTSQLPRLRQDVLNQLSSNDSHTTSAAALIDAAHARGEDVSEALSSLLMAQLKEGHDAKDILQQASCRGVRVHDSVYNSAAQQLATRGDFRGAARVCKLAAKENGHGQLVYSEYNFSNLVYIYTGSARYEALHSVLNEFRSSDQMRWQGSKICKESVKLAMKTVAQRATVQGGEDSEHYQALLDLDATLCHVQQCRRANAAARANKSSDNLVRVALPAGESKPCSLAAQSKIGSYETDQVLLANGL